MAIIPLDRRFFAWTSDGPTDPELLSLYRGGGLRWNDLLEKHRVVVLAEPGSGKTAELGEQARLCNAEGRFCFLATVQNVGTKNVEAALGSAKWAELLSWRASGQPAWFFLDSVDEAKSSNIRLAEALRLVSDAIGGASRRAHIVLSGRYTDWEFRRDLQTMEEWLPMPPADVAATTVDPDELIVSALRRKKPPEAPPAEKPLVVVMGALERAQIDLFARGKGVRNIPTFFSALDQANLWDFARRPLDLDWLVAYWIKCKKFGHLTEMLTLSLRERLQEPDSLRSRRDPLNVADALEALERIGAALVLSRMDDIAVPDSSVTLTEVRVGLDIGEVLPDWSAENRGKLISRAVFDPASSGYARLHNDNEGNVRGFLAARWLHRLRKANCPLSTVIQLLFSDTYETTLVKPSMRKTAAWMSIWDDDITGEVLRRDPRLLMDAGDPGSLPLPVRRAVLERVIAQAINDDDLDIPDRDSLKRFSASDMESCVREQWMIHETSATARQLLLMIIWLGELRACVDISVAASFGTYSDHYTQVFSGRALMASADTSLKRRYARYILKNATAVPRVVLWDAVEALFPSELAISDLLAILAMLPSLENEHTFDYLGPELVSKLTTKAEVESLLSGLLSLLSAQLSDPDGERVAKDEPLLETIEAAARWLLEHEPSDAGLLLAIDTAVRLGEERRNYSRTASGSRVDLLSLLLATPERRRTALWRAAQRFAGAKLLNGRPITEPWHLEMLGFTPKLVIGDLDWLLKDAADRVSEPERRLATNAAMRLWRDGGRDAGVLARIQDVARGDTAVAEALAEWTRPPTTPEQEQELQRQMRISRRRNGIQEAERDKSWIEFAARLRRDPDQLRHLAPPTKDGMDARLFHVWELLNLAGENQNRYAIEDLTRLEPMLGSAVVEAAHEAFTKFWREWTPQLRSEREPQQRNTIHNFDRIGLVGITLEAVGDRDWASHLSHQEALKAATYGTFEINGLPTWFSDLAVAQPAAVREVLTKSIQPDLAGSEDEPRRSFLEDLSGEHLSITAVVAADLFAILESQPGLPPSALLPILRIVHSAFSDRSRLIGLLQLRLESASTIEVQAIYVAALLQADTAAGTSALVAKLSTMPEAEQTELVQLVLPQVFGRRFERGVDPRELPFSSLERLVHVAFGAIRVEEDNDHSDGKVYSPDARDDAQGARGLLFKALVETPGRATFDAIHRFIASSGFPVRRKRLLELAAERAGADSESAPWLGGDVQAFETDFLMVPRTPQDLQRVALGRLRDLQHDLVHSDFAQGAAVARLPNEVDVQLWFADMLRRKEGRSYSIEREPHVAEEKEPDVRFRARATDASVPMEIKVAESWTLQDLEDALTTQLVGRYLRDRSARHGILLLVHQTPRPRGWQERSGRFLTFAKVVDRLEGLARRIAAQEPNAPYVEVAAIDVSTVVSPGARKPRKRAATRKPTTNASSARGLTRPVRTRIRQVELVPKPKRRTLSESVKSSGATGRLPKTARKNSPKKPGKKTHTHPGVPKTSPRGRNSRKTTSATTGTRGQSAPTASSKRSRASSVMSSSRADLTAVKNKRRKRAKVGLG